MSKADLRKTQVDILLELQRENKKQFGAQRQAATGITSAAAGAGIGGSGGGQAFGAPTIGFLKTTGDTMIGPIAYFGKIIPPADLPNVGNNHTLNISPTDSESYSSLVIWTEGGSNQIDIINGAQFTGQVLIIESTEALTQTIRDESNVVGPPAGNIKTLDGNNLVLGTRKTLVWFIFSNIDNSWHQVSNPVVGGGVQASDNIVWTGSHIFNGPSFTVNSPIIQIGFTSTDTLVINASIIGNVFPLTDNSVDLGSLTKRWSDVIGVNIRADFFTSVLGNTFNGTTVFPPGSLVSFNGSVGTGIIPNLDNTHDLGSFGQRWNDIHGVNLRGVTIDATGAATLRGQIFLGTSTSHNVIVNGRIGSDLDPNSSGNRDMGSSGLRWATLFVRNINIDVASGDAIQIRGGGDVDFINNEGSKVDFDGNGISLSASAGFATSVPDKPIAYVIIKVGGQPFKIPYFQ